MSNAIIPLCLFFLIIGCKSEKQEEATVLNSKEKYRPGYHFTPETNWMNDPNGMVYYEGEYHLFYQYNPFGNTWGHMSWGHAVSKDLVQWEHLPLALAEEGTVMIFSGSAVVDWNNTSGFGINNKPPLVAIYTGHEEKNRKQYQSIAYSNDKGRTWTKYEGNPVLDIGMKDFRDPKVFWYETDKKWVMVVALSLERKLHFYSSKNLKEWILLSEFGPEGAVKGIWECPDLFEMKVNGSEEKKWVLGINLGRRSVAGGSGGQYLVGHFDGEKFIMDSNNDNKKQERYTPQTDFIAATVKNGIHEELSNETKTLLAERFFEMDNEEGSYTSKSFLLTSSYVNFLMGTIASKENQIPEIELWIDGKRIRNAANNEHGQLEWKTWNIDAYKGKEARLKVKKEEAENHLVIDALHLDNKAAFNLAEDTKWMDYGADFYAAVSWSDIPKDDGRRLWIGWMNNWHYATTIPSGDWRSSMSIARNLELVKNDSEYLLVQEPVEELKKYRTSIYEKQEVSLKDFREQLSKLDIGDQFEVILEMNLSNAQQVEMHFGEPKLPAISWIYDVETQLVNTARLTNGNEYFHPKFSNSQQFKVELKDNILKLHFFVDRNSLEIFHQEGLEVFTELMYPVGNDFRWDIKSEQEGEINLKKVSIYKL